MRLGFSVDFALLLYDEFNGSAIQDANVLFRNGDRIVTPLRKREGFYVFHGLFGDEWDISVARPHYLPERFAVDRRELVPGEPVVTRRLLRSPPGVWQDCQWSEGECEPGRPVMILSREPALRLQSVEGRKVSALGYGGGRLVGRRFALGEKNPESFVFLRQMSPGVYLADRDLEGAWKSGEPMYRAYLSRGDANGRYRVPVEESLLNGPGSTFTFDGGNGKWLVHASAAARS